MRQRAGSPVRARLREIVLSVYLYNEYRGYTLLSRLEQAIARRFPWETEFLEAVRAHRADEQRHYRMFRGWFLRHHRMPYAIGRTDGYVDQFVERLFRRSPDAIDLDQVLARDQDLFRLCRAVMVTEQRGLRQVEALLLRKFVLEDRDLERIFRVVKRDEPSHFLPYRDWLARHGASQISAWESLQDLMVHWRVIFVRIPILMISVWLPRRTQWPHEA